MWRGGVKQWTRDRGRITELGDIAHAFLPNAGLVAVQTLEDAISSEEC
jgi:hypothetical protein